MYRAVGPPTPHQACCSKPTTSISVCRHFSHCLPCASPGSPWKTWASLLCAILPSAHLSIPGTSPPELSGCLWQYSNLALPHLILRTLGIEQKQCWDEILWYEHPYQKTEIGGWALVTLSCNPSYLGGSDQEDHSLKTAQGNSLCDPISKIPNTKKGLVEWLKW
jgi:hypothetical protein